MSETLESELDLLQERAETGDLRAAEELGARLLVGRAAPASPSEAATWLERAARRGSLRALRLTATLAAAGIGRPQNWPEALERLEAAAAAGDPSAQAQLRLLASSPDGVTVQEIPPTASWRELREVVRPDAWTAAVERRAACEAPRIREIERFLAPQVCDWLIGQSKGRLQRAMMYNPETRRDEPHPGRTNSLWVVDVFGADVVTALVRARMAATVKIPLPCFEPTQILHYAPGEMIAPHFDFLEGREIRGYDTGARYTGQRIATFLVYLNDAYEAGETVFPRAGYSFKGRTGSALYFANVDGEARPERLSLHAGSPPQNGAKWLLSQWIHNQPFTGVLQS